MGRLLGQRLLHGLLLLFGVSVLTFLFTELAPGDYFDGLRLEQGMTEEAVEAMRERFGFGQPLPVRYGRWLASVLRGDLGLSVEHKVPVAELLRERAGNTLVLTVPATLLAWLVAVPLGIWAAERRRARRAVFAAGTSLLLAIPDLVLGLALLMLAVRTRWFPTGGMTSLDFERLGFWGKAADLGHHLILPVAALVLTTVPVLARHVQASVAEVLSSPYIHAVRARGLGRRRLLFRHALPAAANPLISLFGFSVAALLSASLLIEIILSWPGVGPLLLGAILSRDIFVVIASVMLSTLLLVAGNLIADLLLLFSDPRIQRVG